MVLRNGCPDERTTALKPSGQIIKDSNRERKIAALNRITGVLSDNSMTLEEARAERLKNQ
jgi:hypothetical protein